MARTSLSSALRVDSLLSSLVRSRSSFGDHHRDAAAYSLSREARVPTTAMAMRSTVASFVAILALVAVTHANYVTWFTAYTAGATGASVCSQTNPLPLIHVGTFGTSFQLPRVQAVSGDASAVSGFVTAIDPANGAPSVVYTISSANAGQVSVASITCVAGPKVRRAAAALLVACLVFRASLSLTRGYQNQVVVLVTTTQDGPLQVTAWPSMTTWSIGATGASDITALLYALLHTTTTITTPEILLLYSSLKVSVLLSFLGALR